jgi:hypothetical protein
MVSTFTGSFPVGLWTAEIQVSRLMGIQIEQKFTASTPVTAFDLFKGLSRKVDLHFAIAALDKFIVLGFWHGFQLYRRYTRTF